jgi:hypothetical protein
MGMIVKLAEDKYVEWSSVVDAPSSSVMNHQELEQYLKATHEREEGLFYEQDPKLKALKMELVATKISQRLARLAQKGTSAVDEDVTVDTVIAGNRAGPNETELSIKEIIELYTYSAAKKGKFPFS